MGKPQVTLTLAGDESKLTQAFDRVGESSQRMASSVGESSRVIAEESTSGFDRAAEGADNAEGKAQGFASTLTGTKDLMSATGEIARGNYFEGLVMAGQGAADLAEGLNYTVIPAVKALATGFVGQAAQAARATTAAVVHRGAQIATAAATKTMAAAQYVLNAALRANPIGLVITAIGLLVAGIIYAYNRSETFRNIVNGALNAVKNVAVSVFGWIRDNWKTITNILLAPFALVVKPIWKHRDSILGAIKAVPGAISGFMKGVADIITAPFRAAFNGIRSAWNSTVGGKGFTVPGWIPEVGGKGFTIPYFHTGGIVSGAMGSETLAMLRAGERVTGGRNSGGGAVVVLQSDGTRTGDALIRLLKESIRIRGGDVQVVLGG